MCYTGGMTTTADIDRYTTKTEKFERRTFVGPFDESKEMLDALGTEWHIIRSGPYTDRKMWPKVDVTRYMLIAERKI
jgi:hypothetical protein